MSTKVAWDMLCKGLWNNARDAIRHALEHVRELASTREDKAHHLKWIILSAHQAAECFCNILLIRVNPGHSSLTKNGRPWYPSLRFTVQELLREPLNRNLTPGERRLHELLKELPDIRDRLMHCPLPDALDSSVAAISLLGLLRVARKHLGEPAPEFESDYPRIESEVFSVITYKRLDEYCRLAEELLREEFPDRLLGYCSNCGTSSVVAGHCEICFEEMDSFECPYCGEEDLIPSWQRHLNPDLEIECPSCGKTYTA